MKVLRVPEVLARHGVSRTTIFRLERDGEFPQRIQLSRNSVGWAEDEIDAFHNALRAGKTAKEAVAVAMEVRRKATESLEGKAA